MANLAKYGLLRLKKSLYNVIKTEDRGTPKSAGTAAIAKFATIVDPALVLIIHHMQNSFKTFMHCLQLDICLMIPQPDICLYCALQSF